MSRSHRYRGFVATSDTSMGYLQTHYLDPASEMKGAVLWGCMLNPEHSPESALTPSSSVSELLYVSEKPIHISCQKCCE